MTTSTCSRTWEAEASRDGRLSKGASASFEQHCSACASCREAADGLDALAEQLRAADPALDEMASRRLRQRVLRSANGLALSPAAAQRRRWRVGARALGTLALAFGALLLALSMRHSAQVPQAISATAGLGVPAEPLGMSPSGPGSDVLAQGEPGSIWNRRASGGLEEITLSEGTLSIEVRHPTVVPSSSAGPSGMPAPLWQPGVLVRVPDGQILDLGTRFCIVVQRNQTVEIAVNEGAVLFQRPGFADVQVQQGSTWRSREELTSSPNATPPSSVAMQQREPVSSALATAPSSAPRRAGGAQRRERPSGGDPNTGAAPGSADEAARAAEDAAYLQWITLLRAGRRSAAHQAGLDYLRRFPDAFRRAEVQAAVAPLAPPPASVRR